MDDAVEGAWGLIANVSGGDWTKQSEEWQAAAKRWRNKFVTGTAPLTHHPAGLDDPQPYTPPA